MVSTIAIGTLLALTAGSKVVAGISQSRSAKEQASQFRLQAEAERTQAAVESEERQRELRRVLASQRAIFGGSGVSLSSGTPLTLAAESTAEAGRQERRAGVFSQARAGLLSSQASQSRSQGKGALLGGFLGGASSLLSFAIPSIGTGSVPKFGGGGGSASFLSQAGR